MDKSFAICSYWLAREETPRECAQRTSRFLQTISSIDSILETWYEYATRKRPALEFEVNEENLERLFTSGVIRNDTDHSVIPQLGFSIGLASSPDQGPLTVRVSCGCYSRSLPNTCIISCPLGDGLPESILNVSTLQKLMMSMIDCFDAHHGAISCHELNERIEFPSGLPRFGWLTYFSNEFRKLPDFNPPTRVVPVEGKGNIVILTDERFDSERPDHLAIAKDVVTTLRKAKVIPKP